MMKGYHKISDWTLARMAYELEKYNGFGYRLYHSSVLSPYLWSGTTHYVRGKYVADGKWSSSAVSKQAGAIPVLKLIWNSDEVLAKRSTKIKGINHAQNFTKLAVVSTGGLLTSANIDSGIHWIKDLHAIIPWQFIIGFAAAGVLWWVTNLWIKSKHKEDYENGLYVPSELVDDSDDT